MQYMSHIPYSTAGADVPRYADFQVPPARPAWTCAESRYRLWVLAAAPLFRIPRYLSSRKSMSSSMRRIATLLSMCH